MDLITAAECAALLGVSAADTLLVLLVNGANTFAKKSCGRTFERKVRTESGRGWGGDVIFVREPPIFAVTEVRIDTAGAFGDDTVVDLAASPNEFHFNADPADDDPRVWRRSDYFPDWPGVWRLIYEGGYYPSDDADPLHVPRVPDDLRAELILDVVTRFKVGPEVVQGASSFSQGALSVTFHDDAVSPRLARVLAHYRK